VATKLWLGHLILRGACFEVVVKFNNITMHQRRAPGKVLGSISARVETEFEGAECWPPNRK